MRQYKNLILLTAAFALIIIFLGFYPAFQSVRPARSIDAGASTNLIQINDVKFYTTFDAALEKANATGKPVFVYINSRTCGWCKKFESESFTDVKAVNMLSRDFIPLSIDADEHRLAVGTPTMIFADSTGQEIGRINGYVETDIFIKNMEKFAVMKNEQT